MAIELSKKGEKINLEKKTSSSLGEIIINLNWNQTTQRKGLFSYLIGTKSLDLDLGCLYELKNGSKAPFKHWVMRLEVKLG